MASRVIEQVTAPTPSLSFEFFPPKTDQGERNLWAALDELAELSPDFVSVTYGAGGSTRDRTVAITKRIAQDTDLVPVGHLTCVGATTEQVRAVVGEFADAGVTNLLALRGDPEGGPTAPWVQAPGGLNYASDLVRLIKSEGDFCVGVAAALEGHPASDSLDQDVQAMLAKQEAGAEFALSQFFFEVETYFDFVHRCEAAGVTIPIVPGIWPIKDLAHIQRISSLAGTEFPTAVEAKFADVESAAVEARGIELAIELCQALLDGGAPGLHFFPLNRAEPVSTIVRSLDLGR